MGKKNQTKDFEKVNDVENLNVDEETTNQSEQSEEIFEADVVDDLEETEKLEDSDNQDNKEEIDDIKDKFIRLQADFANYKRRTELEKSNYISLGTEKVFKDLINVLDNFERALDTKSEHDKFSEGIELIYNQLLEVFAKNNVVEIKALEETFDPNLHYAVFAEEKEGVDEGIVIEVLQKGYKINDKVLRPAMVKVSK